MLGQSELEEIGRQMEAYSSAFRNAKEINKQLAELDASRALLVDKLTFEEEQASIASETINAIIEDIDDNDKETVSQIENLAKDKMFDVFMVGVFDGIR